MFLDAKRLVSFALEDKHAVNEHHVARKSNDATQKKNVLTWCIFKYHVTDLKQTRGIKIGQKIRGCRGLLERVTMYELSIFTAF